MKKKNNYIVSSGNVFSDLELPEAEEMLTKAELARQVNHLIEQKNLTQTAAAKLLEIDQPKISALSKGKLSGFSLERLFRFLGIVLVAMILCQLFTPYSYLTKSGVCTLLFTIPAYFIMVRYKKL